ncbi:hypothetical protein [Natronoflexus pectinivorans]|nr:hypothetical protein [Natronoflexus pectinivorans]
MNSEPDDSLRDVFIYIVPIFVVNGFVAGQIIFKSRLKKIKTYNNLSSKMVAYRGAMIIRLAMLEGASLFTITICFLTADLTFLAISVFIIIYFIILKPTVEKIAVDLELNRSEKIRIGNPNEVIAVFETNQ